MAIITLDLQTQDQSLNRVGATKIQKLIAGINSAYQLKIVLDAFWQEQATQGEVKVVFWRDTQAISISATLEDTYLIVPVPEDIARGAGVFSVALQQDDLHSDSVKFEVGGVSFDPFDAPSSVSTGVASFKGRTGAVVPRAGDYDISMITGGGTGSYSYMGEYWIANAPRGTADGSTRENATDVFPSLELIAKYKTFKLYFDLTDDYTITEDVNFPEGVDISFIDVNGAPPDADETSQWPGWVAAAHLNFIGGDVTFENGNLKSAASGLLDGKSVINCTKQSTNFYFRHCYMDLHHVGAVVLGHVDPLESNPEMTVGMVNCTWRSNGQIIERDVEQVMYIGRANVIETPAELTVTVMGDKRQDINENYVCSNGFCNSFSYNSLLRDNFIGTKCDKTRFKFNVLDLGDEGINGTLTLKQSSEEGREEGLYITIEGGVIMDAYYRTETMSFVIAIIDGEYVQDEIIVSTVPEQENDIWQNPEVTGNVTFAMLFDTNGDYDPIGVYRRNDIESLTEKIGDMSTLETDNKESIVGAINEVKSHATRNDDITAIFGSPVGLVIGTGTYVKVPMNMETGVPDSLTNEEAFFEERYDTADETYYTLRDGKRVALKYPSLNMGGEIELFDGDGNFTLTRQNLPQGVFFSTIDNCFTFQMTPGIVVSAFDGSPDLGYGDRGKILGVVIDDVPRLVRQLGDIDLVPYQSIPETLPANQVLYALSWLISRATQYVDSTLNNVNINDLGILEAIPAEIPDNHDVYFGMDVDGAVHKFVLKPNGTEEGYKPIDPAEDIFTLIGYPPIPEESQFYKLRFPENISVNEYISLNPSWNQSFSMYLTINQPDLEGAIHKLLIYFGESFFKGYRGAEMEVSCPNSEQYFYVTVYDNETSQFAPDEPSSNNQTWDDVADVDLNYNDYHFKSDKTTREIWVEDGDGNPVPLTFTVNYTGGNLEELKREYFTPSANFARMANHVFEIYGIREAFVWADTGEEYVSELHQDRNGNMSYRQYGDILRRLNDLENA